MNYIGKSERISQNRIVQLFQDKLKYQYLGDWQEETRIQPIEESILKKHLLAKGYSEVLAQKAVDEVVKTAKNLSSGLYDANKEVYRLLRYGSRLEKNWQPKKRFG
jgi:type I restriction enzyme R subunit